MKDNNDYNKPKKEKSSMMKKITSSIFNINNEDGLLKAIQKATNNNVIDKSSQNMLIGAMKISSLDVKDIMISHTKIIALDMSMK